MSTTTNRKTSKAERVALEAADKAGNDAFDRHNRGGAGHYVPDAAVAAAQAAYEAAGGTRKIVVRGYGNTTHPVCGVEVRHAKRGE